MLTRSVHENVGRTRGAVLTDVVCLVCRNITCCLRCKRYCFTLTTFEPFDPCQDPRKQLIDYTAGRGFRWARQLEPFVSGWRRLWFPFTLGVHLNVATRGLVLIGAASVMRCDAS